MSQYVHTTALYIIEHECVEIANLVRNGTLDFLMTALQSVTLLTVNIYQLCGMCVCFVP